EARHEGGPGAETQGTGRSETKQRKTQVSNSSGERPPRFLPRARRSVASARTAARRSTERKRRRRDDATWQRHHRGDVALRKPDVAKHPRVPLEEFGDGSAIACGLPGLDEP